MKENFRNLHHGFLESVRIYPNNIALDAPSGRLTYQALFKLSASIALALAQDRAGDSTLTAVLASRDVDAFAGILGVLMSGHGYVPLNPLFPVARISNMLRRSCCDTLVVGRDEVLIAAEVIALCPHVIKVVVPGTDDVESMLSYLPRNRKLTIVTQRNLTEAKAWTNNKISQDAIAYLLFTSGSTGEPKGVMVAQRNIRQFIDVMQARYQIGPEDRVSQMFELVFDLSLFDLFMTWEVGATLCVPTRNQLIIPADYINTANITVWFSVPSVALLLKKLRRLEPGIFPSLRLSLFCGEALPCEIAADWALAAPRSVIENLYGPTEVTLACLLYQWQDGKAQAESKNDVVPIGNPYPEMKVCIVDEQLQPVEYGQTGELLISGPQVAIGYWQDNERTEASFIKIQGDTSLYYRTGDLVSQQSEQHPIIYLGRLDQQIKMHGHRVELGDIEASLRLTSKCDQAIVVPWPIVDGAIQGLVAFLETEATVSVSHIKEQLESQLPKYMVPADIRSIQLLPLNPNGKIDRNALRQILEQQQ